MLYEIIFKSAIFYDSKNENISIYCAVGGVRAVRKNNIQVQHDNIQHLYKSSKNNRTIKKIKRKQNQQIQHKLEVGLNIEFDFTVYIKLWILYEKENKFGGFCINLKL